jgi:HEAT repeat protein
VSALSVSEIKKIDDKNKRHSSITVLNSDNLSRSDVQGLIELFCDPYWPVREAAAKKLISTGPRVCESLVNAISDPNEDIRFWSSQILATIADDNAICLLINSFASYEENDINMYSARALVKVGASALIPLIEALGSPDDLIRLYSLHCLGELKSAEAVPAIERLLAGDANFAIRKNAAIALGKIGTHSSANALIEAISDKSWYVRVAATEALGKFKFAGETPGFQPGGEAFDGGEKKELKDRITNSILASLSDTEARVRETGAKVLGELGGDRAQQQLIKLLQNSNSEGEKIIAVKSIDGSLTAEALPVIASLLDDKNSPELKKEALKTLGRIPGDEAKKYILDLIDSENSEIVTTAVTALFEFKTPSACDAVPALLEDPREDVRISTAASLGGKDYFDMRHYLYSALEDSSYLVRRQALISLYSLLGDEAISEVITLINDADEFTASEAIAIAAKIKNPDAIPALARAVETGSNRLAYMAFQTLSAIGANAEYVILNSLDSDNPDICYWAIGALEKNASVNCIVPLLKTITKHSARQEIVERALEVLMQFEFEIDEKFFIDILKNLKSSHNKAIELLSKSKSRDIAFELLPYLKSGEKETRFHAARALGRLANDDEKITAALIESLKDRYWPVRKAAAESLAVLGENAVKSLKKELEQAGANADIVYWALRALADKAEKDSIPVFKKYIDSKSSDIKKIIIKGLGKIGDDESLEPLLQFLQSQDDELRFHTVKSLKNCSNPKILTPLIKMMGDSYENVRSFAAIALGNFKSEPAAVQALKGALNDGSHWVVKYAKESLSKLNK